MHFALAVITKNSPQSINFDELMAKYISHTSELFTIAIAAADEHNRKKNDDEECVSFETYLREDDFPKTEPNPYAKIESWRIGGRWKNRLLLKNGTYATHGKVGDIVWNNVPDINKYIVEHPQIISEYESLLLTGDSIWNASYCKDFYPTIDHWIKHKEQFLPYAVITPDGTWHEKSSSGALGLTYVSPEEEHAWSDAYYNRFIKNYLDCYVTIIDAIYAIDPY